jgi:hypothetical protein
VNEINSKPKPFQFAIPVQPTNTGKQTSWFLRLQIFKLLVKWSNQNALI